MLTITIMIIIIINVKCFLERHLQDFNKVLENKLILIKKAVLHTTTLMCCNTRQVLRNLFSANQGNGSKMKFMATATKINFKNLKT